jgi:hypothetical protein
MLFHAAWHDISSMFPLSTRKSQAAGLYRPCEPLLAVLELTERACVGLRPHQLHCWRLQHSRLALEGIDARSAAQTPGAVAAVRAAGVCRTLQGHRAARCPSYSQLLLHRQSPAELGTDSLCLLCSVCLLANYFTLRKVWDTRGWREALAQAGAYSGLKASAWSCAQ